MDYVIKNHRNIYIRLNLNGTPVTCSEKDKTLFEYSKAKNVLSNLPKTLQKLNFKVVCVPDITGVRTNSITKEDYEPPDEVTRWLDKFGICDEIISEARTRKRELLILLSTSDKELSNEVHKIELEKWKDACAGYNEYKAMKNILEKRRIIKDELMIISRILNMNFSNFDTSIINKEIKSLATRRFTYRVVEEQK